MKKMMTMAAMMMIVISASAMPYTQARNEALFLTDKMAYELDLSYAQYDAVYEINLDYYLCVTGNNLFGVYWQRRNADLRYVLTNWQYDRYMELSYFYRPVQYSRNTWYFSIYRQYGKTQYYRDRPTIYNSYRGGNNKISGSYYKGRDYDKPVNKQYKPHSNDMPPHQGNSNVDSYFGKPNGKPQQGDGYDNGRGRHGNGNQGGSPRRNMGNSSGNSKAPSAPNTNNSSSSSKRTGTFGGRAK